MSPAAGLTTSECYRMLPKVAFRFLIFLELFYFQTVATLAKNWRHIMKLTLTYLSMLASALFLSVPATASPYSVVQIDGISGGLVNQASATSGHTVALSGTGVGSRGGTTLASARAFAIEGLLAVNTRVASTATSHINSAASAQRERGCSMV